MNFATLALTQQSGVHRFVRLAHLALTDKLTVRSSQSFYFLPIDELTHETERRFVRVNDLLNPMFQPVKN
jgi:hypothetical protein